MTAASGPTPAPAALRRNVRLVLLLAGAWMFLVIMPVVVPYLPAHGLSMTEVFTLQAIFAAAVVVLEVPSGYAADLLGRKRCLCLGAVFYGSAFTLLALADGFTTFVGFELLAFGVFAAIYALAVPALLLPTRGALTRGAEDEEAAPS